jgi:hypothetical protein
MMCPVVRRTLLTALVLVLPGCGPGLKPDFEAGFARQREAAIVEEVRKGDAADLRAIVRMLDASEPSTRMLAIDGLERLTGTNLGYDPFGPKAEREVAIERWRVRVAENVDGGVQP